MMNIKNRIYSEMYAYLFEGISLHYTQSSGYFLVCPKPNMYFKFSKNIANFLTACEGSSTLGKLLIRYIYEDGKITKQEKLEDMIMISRLINSGAIILSDKTIKKQVKIIDDSKYYIPSNVQMELTTACNLKCYYCYRSSGRSEILQPVETDQLLLKLEELADFGLASIEITGGEPLLHPDFIKIISLCYEKFVLIGLLTNGTLLNEKKIKEIEPFKDKIVISVSLDCHIPHIHDKRRGMKGAFEKTTTAIKMLSKHGFLTRVAMVIDKENWTYIEPTILLAKSLGASTFGYSPILPFGRGKDNFEFWDAFVNEFLKSTEDIVTKYKDFLNLKTTSDIKELQRPGGCGAGHRVFAIDPKGNVRPCTTFDDKTAIFGNIYKDELKVIFGKDTSDWFSRAIAPGSKYCNGCIYELFCRYCILRGLTASKWIEPDKFNWLNQPENQNLRALMT